MGAAPDLRIVSSCDGELVDSLPALIAPGEYRLILDHWITWRLFGRQPKLALWFKVADNGEAFGALVPKYYNVLDLKGKPGRNGQFKAAAGGDFARDYNRLLWSPRRLDRFNLEQFRRTVIVGQVGTVTKGFRQERLAPASQYSVVRTLVKMGD